MRAFLLGFAKTAATCFPNRFSSSLTARWFETWQTKSLPNRKVAILGAGSSVGQRTTMFMKLNPLVTNLALYDVAGSKLPTANLTTRPKVVGSLGEGKLGEVLEGADVVIMAPQLECRRLGRADEELSAEDTRIFKSLCSAIAEHCPRAIVNILSNPVDSVPIASEIFKKAGIYDENKLLGVFASKHAQETRAINVHSDEVTKLVKVTTGKDLRIAYSAAVVADLCLRTLNNIPDVEDVSFVQPIYFDSIGLILCASKFERTNSDLIMEWFSHWKLDRRHELYPRTTKNNKAPKDKTTKASTSTKNAKAP